VSGQWQKGSDGLELRITNNSHAPEIPTNGKLELI